ncbi:MAG: hypothetical protein AAFX05_04365 [Planctomycetota bacterium]
MPPAKGGKGRGGASNRPCPCTWSWDIFLEEHRGEDRNVICLQKSIGDRTPEDVWAQMVESTRYIVRSWPESPTTGDTVTIALTASETTDGTVFLLNERRQLVLRVAALNDALVRFTIEPNCSEGFEELAAGVFAGTFGIDANRLGLIRSYWIDQLEAML